MLTVTVAGPKPRTLNRIIGTAVARLKSMNVIATLSNDMNQVAATVHGVDVLFRTSTDADFTVTSVGDTHRGVVTELMQKICADLIPQAA